MERRPHAFSTWLSTTWRTRISFSWRVHDAAGAGLRSSFSDAGRLLGGAEPEVALLAATRPGAGPRLRVVEAPRDETVGVSGCVSPWTTGWCSVARRWFLRGIGASERPGWWPARV